LLHYAKVSFFGGPYSLAYLLSHHTFFPHSGIEQAGTFIQVKIIINHCLISTVVVKHPVEGRSFIFERSSLGNILLVALLIRLKDDAVGVVLDSLGLVIFIGHVIKFRSRVSSRPSLRKEGVELSCNLLPLL